MILISTGTYSNQTVEQTVCRLASAGVSSIELSGGKYQKDQVDKIKKLNTDLSFFVHNYFPPAEVPFVFNLASLDSDTELLSLDHAKKSIRLAAELGNPIYSFHAGYLLALEPHELGKLLTKRKIHKRKECLNIFLERVNELAEFAENLGVKLLIENNVLSESNHIQYKSNPLLMVTPEETTHIMENTPDNVNLLVDVAHLAVSAKTLGFNPARMFENCDRWIKAYHISENDGTSDSNDPIQKNSWFWPYIKPEFEFCTLEIKNLSYKKIKKQYDLARKILGRV